MRTGVRLNTANNSNESDNLRLKSDKGWDITYWNSTEFIKLRFSLGFK